MTVQAQVSSSAQAKSVANSPPARTKLLLEGPIFPTLLRLAAPNVLNFLAFVGVITFDGFFLGRIGTDALAGASLAFPWIMLVLQTTNSGMGAGVSSAVARALGANRRDRADDLVFHALLLAGGLEQLGRVVHHAGQRNTNLRVAEKAVVLAQQRDGGRCALLQGSADARSRVGLGERCGQGVSPCPQGSGKHPR